MAMKFGLLLFLLGVAQGKSQKFNRISPIFSVFNTLHVSVSHIFIMLNENVPRVECLSSDSFYGWVWELPNSRVWLDEIDIGSDLFSHLYRHLDRLQFAVKRFQTKTQKYWLLSSNNTYLWKCQRVSWTWKW